MSEPRGSFVWYELMTTDMDAAEAFYRSVVGWTAQDSGHPDMRYVQFYAGASPVAGLMQIPAAPRAAGAGPSWLGYVGVGGLEAAVSSLTQAGGSLHRAPAEIPNIGRFAVVADPQGVAFVLFTPSERGQQPRVQPGAPGHVGWHELHTSDWQAALRFYSSQFGWTKAEALDMGPMGTYQLFADGDQAIGGMMNGNAPHPFWLFYFAVDALDAACERIREGGGEVLNGPAEVPGGGWIVQARDPQGAMFALVAPRR